MAYFLSWWISFRSNIQYSDNNKLIRNLQDEVNPCRDWLSSKSWNEILALKVLPNFIDFVDTFSVHKNIYKTIFESQEPHK